MPLTDERIDHFVGWARNGMPRSAIMDAVAEAEAQMLERCAELCDRYGSAYFAQKIREMKEKE